MSVSTITIAGNSVNLVAMPATPGLQAIEFTAFDGVGVSRRPFSGAVQVQSWQGGDMWRGKATLPPLAQKDADPWIAALEELRGKFNAFQMGDPLKAAPRGSLAGNPYFDNTVSGGNAPGSQTLGTAGWTPNAMGILMPGDYLQVGYRLHRALDVVNADSDGNAVFQIWPSLREQPISTGSAGWIEAAGSVGYTISRSLGNNVAAVIWKNFVLSSALPADAVIQGIYPVTVLSAVSDIADQYLKYGTGFDLLHPVQGTGFQHPFGTPSGIPNATFASTLCYGDSLGTALSLASSEEIRALLNTSIVKNPVTDLLTITAVGMAVYYSSATPTTDAQIDAPFSVPSGQGLAWALPTEVAQSGSLIGSSGLIGSSTGFGFGTAAIDVSPIFSGAKGIWRLAKNDRDWAADIERYSSVTFPFQEYR